MEDCPVQQDAVSLVEMGFAKPAAGKDHLTDMVLNSGVQGALELSNVDAEIRHGVWALGPDVKLDKGLQGQRLGVVNIGGQELPQPFRGVDE